MKRAITCCIVVVTALVVGIPAAAGGLIELRSENAAGQHGSAQPLQLITEHSAGQHVAQAPQLASVVVAPTDTSSFSWRDAGVGAAGVAVLLLLFAAALAAYRRGRPAATQG